MEENHLKKHRIVYVDGFKIRNFLDDDFAIIHNFSNSACYSYPKFYIPQDEIWIDWRYKDETDFLLKVFYYESSQTIKSYIQLRKLIKEEFCKKEPAPDFRIRQEINNNLTIVYVDGRIIREYIDPEFALGGHSFVYDYIPKGEIWLDNKMDSEEIPYIFLHEQVERDLMSNGKKYDIAHEYATTADKEERRKKSGASYPGDENYILYGKNNEEIKKEITVAE